MLISRKRIFFDVLKRLCVASRTEVGASWLCAGGPQLANSESSNELQQLPAENIISAKFEAGSILLIWWCIRENFQHQVLDAVADDFEAKCVFNASAVKNDAASARLQ